MKNMKFSFSVKQKIIVSYLIVIIFMAFVISFSIYQTNEIQKQYENIINQHVSHLIEVQQFQKRMLEEIDLIKKYGLTQNSNLIDEIDKSHAANHLTLEALIYKSSSKSEKNELNTLKQLYNNFTKDEKQMIQAIKENKLDVFVVLMENKFDEAVGNKIDNIVQNIRIEMNAQQQKMSDDVKKMKEYVIYSNIFILIFTLAMAFYIASKIANPVKTLARQVQRMAQGDLTENIQRIKSKDEIGNLLIAFQLLQDQLRDLINKIQINSEQVASTSVEISASTEETTKSIEQITLTMQEMSTSSDQHVHHVREASDNVDQFRQGIHDIIQYANNVTRAVLQTSETANQGFNTVEEAKKQMNEVGNTVDASVQVITKLNQQSEHISEIVELITDIAEQTNLLALNAAIEAARAGEQGRGFAVVADEVRKLAEQSANAGKTISEMMLGIRNDTETAVQTMINGNQEVKEGILIVDKVSKGFNDILSAIEHVSNSSDATLQAARNMETYVEQVVVEMDELEKGIENNAEHTQTVAAASEEQNASIEEISSSFESLSSMAEELNELIKQFKLKS